MRGKTNTFVLVMAVVVAVIAAISLHWFLNDIKEEVEVLVAKTTIEPRTIITPSHLTTQKVHKNAVQPDSYLSIDELFANNREIVAKTHIHRGQQIIRPAIETSTDAAQSLSFYLRKYPSDYRIVTLRVNDLDTFGGRLVEGDFIDVFAFFRAGGNLNFTDHTVIRAFSNLEVIDIVDENTITILLPSESAVQYYILMTNLADDVQFVLNPLGADLTGTRARTHHDLILDLFGGQYIHAY